jgi:hypothetical protein
VSSFGGVLGCAGSGTFLGLGTFDRFGRDFPFAGLEPTRNRDHGDEFIGIVRDEHAGGQCEISDAELIAEDEGGHVVFDFGGELTGFAFDREGVHELFEHAALRDPFGCAQQVQSHLGLNGLVGPDPDEVDVDQRAFHRVALHLSGERKFVLAADLQGDQRVDAGPGGKDVAELVRGHGDGDAVAAEAVHDAREEPFTA